MSRRTAGPGEKVEPGRGRDGGVGVRGGGRIAHREKAQGVQTGGSRRGCLRSVASRSASPRL
eukprot:7850401-Pyramimonas_sp.AAC.1